MNSACRSCGSKRVLRRARVTSRVIFGSHPVFVELLAGSAGQARSPLSAQVCVDCGSVEFQVTEPAKFKRVYGAVGEPLGLNS
jgi:ribosomal protein L40E